MPVRKTIDDGRVPVHVCADDVEAGALKQLVVHTLEQVVCVEG